MLCAREIREICSRQHKRMHEEDMIRNRQQSLKPKECKVRASRSVGWMDVCSLCSAQAKLYLKETFTVTASKGPHQVVCLQV